MSGYFTGKVYNITRAKISGLPQQTDLYLAISEPDERDILELLPILKAVPRFPDELIVFDGQSYVDTRVRSYAVAGELAESLEELEPQVLKGILNRLTLREVRRFYEAVHKREIEKPFIPGETKINYAGRVYDSEEMEALVDSSLDFYLTAHRYDKKFCANLASYLKSPGMKRLKVLTVNSGSSANLAALSSLTSSSLGEWSLKQGDEVLTTAVCFPTTLTPILLNGLIPVFADVELGTYNIDIAGLESAITERTKVVFLAHTLGIPFNLDKILELAEKYKLWVIEDNCDALGAQYDLAREYKLIHNHAVSGKHYTGTCGQLGTSSFYPPHHMTMGEGGAVYASDPALYNILLSFRDWGRDCWCETGCDDTCGKRFEWQLGDLPGGYDHKYTYSHFGFNLKITDMQAAIGVAQLRKMPDFVNSRNRNWKMLRTELAELENEFIMPTHPERADPSPFGFAMTIRDNAKVDRGRLVKHLESKHIQTRMLFAGNILRQPAFKNGGYKHRTVGALPNSDTVMNKTFWFGVYPGMTENKLSYIVETIKAYIRK